MKIFAAFIAILIGIAMASISYALDCDVTVAYVSGNAFITVFKDAQAGEGMYIIELNDKDIECEAFLPPRVYQNGPKFLKPRGNQGYGYEIAFTEECAEARAAWSPRNLLGGCKNFFENENGQPWIFKKATK